MNEAVVLLILAAIALGVTAVVFTLRIGWVVTEALVGLVRHELLMRPKERYYRM